MDPTAKLLLNYIKDVLNAPESAALDIQQLPEGFQDFGKELKSFAECILEASEIVKLLSNGHLSVKLPQMQNEITAPVKNLHASLKHLAWQTEQVARGDYQQRVDFMGEFSSSFNNMAYRLEQRHQAFLKDIENRRRENYIIQQNKNLYELLVGKLEQWIVVTDINTGNWLFVSREIDDELASLDYGQKFQQWIEEQLEEMKGMKDACTKELELLREDGVHYYSILICPIHWNGYNALAFLFADITRERRKLKNLQDIANYDTLTQVYSRHYGMQTLNEWIEEKRDFILCFTDIDNLKKTNDEFGHSEGDRYITYVSGVLREFSPRAVVCRMGGDEFILLIENTELKDAKEMVERMREELNKSNIYLETGYHRSISYGMIHVKADNTLSAQQLLNKADKRMYRYKRAFQKECVNI